LVSPLEIVPFSVNTIGLKIETDDNNRCPGAFLWFLTAPGSLQGLGCHIVAVSVDEE